MKRLSFNRMLALLLWVPALCAGFSACSSGDDEGGGEPAPSKPSIENFTQGDMNFTEEAAQQSFTFTANADWTLSVASTGGTAWCTATPSSGTAGAQNVLLKVTENEGYDDRSVTVTLKAPNYSKSFVVTQKQKDALLLTADKYEVAQEGGKITVEVKANVSYTATIGEACKGWIEAADAGTRALATTTRSFSVKTNEDSEKREGTITFSDGTLTETVHVYQAGGDLVLLSADEFFADAAGEEMKVELRSNCEYEVAMPGVDWIRPVESTRAMSSHTLRYTILPNEGYDAREAEIIFRSVKDAKRADTLTVTQGQKNAIILSQKAVTVKSEGETFTVKLSANVDYEVTMPADASWLTAVPATRGLTEHSLQYKAEKNEADESRTAKITFSNKDNGLEEVLTVTQEGVMPAPITLHVATPGDLPKKITGNYDVIQNLILTGDLNGDDIHLIRKLNKLAYLDLSGANIVEGGGCYYIYYINEYPKEYYYTANNLIGGYMFYDLPLISIVLPKNVTAIGKYAFTGCPLKNITIPEGVKTIGEGAFMGCSLTSINIPEGVKTIEKETFGVCGSLTSINIPKGVTTIGEGAFSSCSSLTSINIPEGVKTIERGAFLGCRSLTSINIPESVTTIEYEAFRYCSSLTSINIPKSVTYIGYNAFSDCSSLTSINIPEGVTTIKEDTFGNCSSLTSINISEGVTTIEYHAFYGCSSLTSINIPKSVTYIGYNAFSDCSSLTSINIPEGVTTIKEDTFGNCSSLTSINISEGVTTIEYHAFYGCSSLTSINIPKSVTFIEDSAFPSSNVKTVYCYATKPPYLGKYNFTKSETLYVPKGTYQVYYLSPWGGEFNNIIEMEE